MARFAPVVVQTLSDSEESDSCTKAEKATTKSRIHIELLDSSDDEEIIEPQVNDARRHNKQPASTSFMHWQRNRADAQSSPTVKKEARDSRRMLAITPTIRCGKDQSIIIEDDEADLDKTNDWHTNVRTQQKPRHCVFSPTSTEAERIDKMLKSDSSSAKKETIIRHATNEPPEANTSSWSPKIYEEQTGYKVIEGVPPLDLHEETQARHLKIHCPSLSGLDILDGSVSTFPTVDTSDVSPSSDIFTTRCMLTTPTSPPPTFNTALEFQPVGRDTPKHEAFCQNSSPCASDTAVRSRHEQIFTSRLANMQSSPEAPVFGGAPVYTRSTAQEQRELVNRHIELLRTKIELEREVYRQQRLEHETFMASCRREMNRLTRWTMPTIRRRKRRFEDW